MAVRQRQQNPGKAENIVLLITKPSGLQNVAGTKPIATNHFALDNQALRIAGTESIATQEQPWLLTDSVARGLIP